MRKTDIPVQLVEIAIPILIEVVCVTTFIAAAFVWLIILATPTVPV